MGSLRYFDLSNYVFLYDINYVVETGTFLGDGVDYALNFKVDKVFSFEINEELFNRSKDRFKDNTKVELLCEDSSTGLEKLLERKEFADKNCLFFLDAHFPGADAGFSEYNSEKNNDINLPLKKELIAISKRTANNDVIIIDDLRLFESCDGVKDVDQHFRDIGKPHLTKKELVHFNLMDVVFEYFPHHNFVRVYGDEGYLVLTKN